MDPLTQLSIGAAVAAAMSPREQTRLAALLGAVAGAAPYIDVFIHSADDPLPGLFYHRHFLHALIFAPMIGICVAVLFRLLFFQAKVPFKKYALYATAGALTHGLIDACTSYGTSLYWPFSDHRESWDLISLIDPIFTVPLIFLTLFALVWRRPFYAQLAVVLCSVYLGFCGFQRARAVEVVQEIAAGRNHRPEEYSVRPSLGNSVLWRTIYRYKGRYYVDAVWVFPKREPILYKGRSVDVFSVADAAYLAAPDSILGRDIERFRYFSQGYLYRHPQETNVIGDLRFAMYPDSVIPLWGIRFDPMADEHVELDYFRQEVTKDSLTRFWSMVRGKKVKPASY